MEQIGLINKIMVRQESTWESFQLAASSKEMQAHNSGLQDMLQLLKEVRATKDLDLALGVEQLLLHQELKNYANSPEESSSIKKALEQLVDARKSLEVVRDPMAYQSATATYSAKRKEADLPLDSFREFLKSHSTRLGNRMASPLSVPEKNILRQRKENLGMVKEMYMEMQRTALGLANGFHH